MTSGDDKSPSATAASARPRVCLVGPSFRFFSGVSVYTWSVTRALAETPGVEKVSAVLLRRLLPRRFYPGASRVGAQLTDLTYGHVDHFDGIDWYWLPSMVRALWFASRERPTALVMQWWTAAVGHSLLALALWARLRRVPVLLEVHEVQDVGEASNPVVHWYGRTVFKLLLRNSAGVVLHHKHDLELLVDQGLPVSSKPVAIAPHGPYDHHKAIAPEPPAELTGPEDPLEPRTTVNLVYFGVIRQYKGVEDLVEAFDLLPEEIAERLTLTLVGETWEGWTKPISMARSSRYSDRIRIVNRYVTDAEAAYLFGQTDVIVLPYRRSSSSGPLHIAMAHGIRVIMYDHPSLRASAEDYPGIDWVPVGDVKALSRALEQAGQVPPATRLAPAGDWSVTTTAYLGLLDRVATTGGPR